MDLECLSISGSESEDDRSTENENEDNNEAGERENRDEMLSTFPGGDQTAVRNILDAIAPYCESKDMVYNNLRKGK